MSAVALVFVCWGCLDIGIVLGIVISWYLRRWRCESCIFSRPFDAADEQLDRDAESIIYTEERGWLFGRRS
jgi:hypothetical protein